MNLVFETVYDGKSQYQKGSEDALNKTVNAKQEEGFDGADSDAVARKSAVVVHLEHAVLALLAVTHEGLVLNRADFDSLAKRAL